MKMAKIKPTLPGGDLIRMPALAIDDVMLGPATKVPMDLLDGRYRPESGWILGIRNAGDDTIKWHSPLVAGAQHGPNVGLSTVVMVRTWLSWLVQIPGVVIGKGVAELRIMDQDVIIKNLK